MTRKFYDIPVQGRPSLNGAIWALCSAVGMMLVASLVLWAVLA